MAKKTDFSKQLEDVCQDAHDFIKKNVKGKVVLATSKQLKESDNLLYELPFVYVVGKYGEYDEYAVISVEKRGKEIILHTKGKGEASDKRECEISEIDNTNVCFLADEISERLK